jgi:hypothetical protein
VTSADWIQLAGFLVTLVTVILGYLSTRGKVRQVHTLVNSQHDDLVQRTDQLTDSLLNAGVAVPDNPKKPPVSGA